MKWIWLFSSIILEVLGTTCLKLSSAGGKHAAIYATATALLYIACFSTLGVAMRYFSVSTVYATWSGIGVSLLALIGVVFFGDEINALKVASLALVIVGIVGLNMSGVSH